MPPVGYRPKVVAAMPGTAPELAASACCTVSTINNMIRRMRAAGESHIVGWRRSDNGGPWVPVHGAGPGADVVCTLERATHKERRDKLNRLAKANGTYTKIKARHAAAQRARRWRLAEKSQTWMSALIIGKRRHPATGDEGCQEK